MTPDPSWVWVAPALLVAPVLELLLERSAIGRWYRLIPLLLAVMCSLLLYMVPPSSPPGVLLLAVIAALGANVVMPAFSYAFDHMSRATAALIASAISLAIIFVLVPSPLTGMGTAVASMLGLQPPASWPITGLALLVYSLVTGGMGYALALFADEVSDRMSSVFSGIVFGALLLGAGLFLGEAVAGGLLAFAILHFIRFAPEKGIHMLVLFPVVAVAIVVTAFAQANPLAVGSEIFVLPLLVPAVAVLTPFVMLEPQVITAREGISVIAASLVALPVVSVLRTRTLSVDGLNAFRDAFATPLAFDPAVIAWLVLYAEVVLIALAFYLVVVMGFSTLRRAKVTV